MGVKAEYCIFDGGLLIALAGVSHEAMVCGLMNPLVRQHLFGMYNMIIFLLFYYPRECIKQLSRYSLRGTRSELNPLNACCSQLGIWLYIKKIHAEEKVKDAAKAS